MIRLIVATISCSIITGCALDPVNLLLQANAEMYTPPPVDPLEGITPESIGATPGALRHLDCKALAARLNVEKNVLNLINASDVAGRTMQGWHIDAATTVMQEKNCSSPNTLPTNAETTTATKSKKIQNNTPQAPSEKPVSENQQPQEEADPYCFGIIQPVEGSSPRALMAAPTSTPNAHVSYDARMRQFQKFIALSHQTQPGVWHDDIEGLSCGFGLGCTANSFRVLFGPGHLAMLLCETSKEKSMKGFENLKSTLNSPHVIAW